MGELLDRAYQREVLQTLADAFPARVSAKDMPPGDGNSLTVNAKYLEEHELLNGLWRDSTSDPLQLRGATITAKGLDFLEDDGGLGAILGVVTVRLDEQTLKALLIEKVLAAEGDKAEKAGIIAKIKGMKDEAMKKAISKIIDEGLESIPDLIERLPDLLS